VYSRFSQIGYFDDMTRAVDTYQHIAFATIVTPNDLVGTYYDKRWGFSMRVENDTVVGILTGAIPIGFTHRLRSTGRNMDDGHRINDNH